MFSFESILSTLTEIKQQRLRSLTGMPETQDLLVWAVYCYHGLPVEMEIGIEHFGIDGGKRHGSWILLSPVISTANCCLCWVQNHHLGCPCSLPAPEDRGWALGDNRKNGKCALSLGQTSPPPWKHGPGIPHFSSPFALDKLPETVSHLLGAVSASGSEWGISFCLFLLWVSQKLAMTINNKVNNWTMTPHIDQNLPFPVLFSYMFLRN